MAYLLIWGELAQLAGLAGLAGLAWLISELRQYQVHSEETRRSFIIYSFGQSDKLINLCP